MVIAAKKNKKRRTSSSSSGEGFGRSPATSSSAGKANREDDAGGITTDGPRPLQSIVSPSAVATRQEPLPPPPSAAAPEQPDLDLDPGLSPEERSRAILRSRFGLKSFEEQQADIGNYRAGLDAEARKKQRDKLRNIEKLWPEDKDILGVLPPALLKGIDTFLKIGLGICTVAFLAAGVLITIEAGAKATGEILPGGLEAFVLDVVQPNFTPGLGVLLAFSVSLGVFSVALGGSAGSSYREDP